MSEDQIDVLGSAPASNRPGNRIDGLNKPKAAGPARLDVTSRCTFRLTPSRVDRSASALV